MKYKIVISKEGTDSFPFMATAYCESYIKCMSGESPEKAEANLMEFLKQKDGFKLIVKEIEIEDA